ncbi:hypothetical protein LDL36_20270 [Komagataeibacter sp. FNDCR1]|nr:hypothetical protein [Komagataeibacter sp. FNDCR1]
MSDVAELMLVAMRADPKMTEREKDGVRRAFRALIADDYLIEHKSLACWYRDGAGYEGLPVPRLQLRWTDGGTICHYELILQLQSADIRREVDGKTRSCLMAIPMSWTRTSSPVERGPDGKIRKPYRDGRHIEWDAAQLGLPAYVVWRGEAQRLEGLQTNPWLPIKTAKKNGRPILAKIHDDLFPRVRPDRADLKPWNGRVIEVAHPGILDDGLDVGWGMVAPVGHGGFHDDWFAGWMAVPSVGEEQP